jgi:tRNA nucleotidyltransferase (CCA-adding enzyme)
MDQEIIDAVKVPEIKEAFTKKITKERIGVELEKMLSGVDPVSAIRILLDFGYYDAVFECPSSLKDMNYENPIIALELSLILHSIIHKSSILQEWPVQKLGILLPLDGEILKRMYLACCVQPFVGIYTKASKSKKIFLGKWIIQNSIKLSNNDADISSIMVEMSSIIKEWVFREIESTPTYRRELGLFIRRLGNIKCLGDYWPFAILYSMVLEIREVITPQTIGDIDWQNDQILKIVSKYKAFMDAICGLSLEKVHLEKHLLDGKAVSEALNLCPGPSIGKNLDLVMAWQLEHPGSDANTCMKWLLSQSGKSQA